MNHPYRPFLDPLHLDHFWFLLIIPLSIFISLVYKSVRLPDLERLPKQVLIMTLQIITAMIAMGIAFYFFVEYILPRLAPK